MISSSTNKKELVDFLWEWAGNYEWSKLLVNKIVSTEKELQQNERIEIFNYFLQSINLHSGLKSLNIGKPKFSPSNKTILLDKLSKISGVNKLAENQELIFSENITIIYGENGTGKTGYSRILKNLGFSYDTNNDIYSNIFKSDEPQSALIDYRTNNIKDTFLWDGTNNNVDLQNISVFNNNCVIISLSDRQLIVSPIGFHLFNLITLELNKLQELYYEKIDELIVKFDWLSKLDENTAQYNFIKTLSFNSNLTTLKSLATYTEVDKKELKKNEIELSALNKSLIENEINSLISCIKEIDTIKEKIEFSQTHFSKIKWNELIDIRKEIEALEKKTQIGIKDIAIKNKVELYASKEFDLFIKATENYIKILQEPDYPKKDDFCVYCKQPLEKPALELIKSYRNLLNDKTQENIAELNVVKEKIINNISKIDDSLIFYQPSFGLTDKKTPIQPNEISEYNKLINELKTDALNNTMSKDKVFNINYNKYISFIDRKRKELKDAEIDKTKLLLNLSKKEKELKNSIATIKAKEILSTKIDDVKKGIEKEKILRVLHQNNNSFNTHSISRKTTEARNYLIEKDFNRLFKDELKAFRKSHLEIDLFFGTDKGKSKISHRLNNYNLTDILSEGEQKAISLSEFLTELQLDNIKAPVIFDDPVNSLDHRIIDEVAKRFIKLSTNRQVIVFTHSILLLHSFIQQSELATNKQKGIDFRFKKVKTNFDKTGVLDEVSEINSFNYYITKLKYVLTQKIENQDEKTLAAEGYGHLRSAIEVSVENEVLQKTIVRYKKGVSFPALLRVKGIELDKLKGNLNDIYEKCCVYIDGHSSPTLLYTTPTINELKADFESFKEIRKQFK